MASDDPRQALGALIQTPAGQVFSAVLVWLGVALAVGICVRTVHDRATSRDSTQWPAVTGHIVDSEFIRGYRRDVAIVRYRYFVGSHQYEGDRPTFIRDGNYYWAKSVVARYPVGRTVNVYYRPDDPSDSVLEPGSFDQGLETKVWIAIAFACAAVLVFAAMAHTIYVSRTIRRGGAEDA